LRKCLVAAKKQIRMKNSKKSKPSNKANKKIRICKSNLPRFKQRYRQMNSIKPIRTIARIANRKVKLVNKQTKQKRKKLSKSRIYLTKESF
jgi:hypothetical protein